MGLGVRLRVRARARGGGGGVRAQLERQRRAEHEQPRRELGPGRAPPWGRGPRRRARPERDVCCVQPPGVLTRGLGTDGAPEAGTRTAYVPCEGPRTSPPRTPTLARAPSHEHGTYEGCSGQAALCLGLGGYAQRGCGAVWRCMALRLDGCRHGRPCVSAVLSRRPRSTEGKTSDAESSAACHAPESAPRRAAAPPGVPRPCSVGGAATCLGLG